MNKPPSFYIRIILLWMILLLVAACGAAAPTPTPTPTLTLTPSITPSLTPSHTPTITPSPTQTPLPTATFTPSLTPTDTLTPSPTLPPTLTPLPSITPEPAVGFVFDNWETVDVPPALQGGVDEPYLVIINTNDKATITNLSTPLTREHRGDNLLCVGIERCFVALGDGKRHNWRSSVSGTARQRTGVFPFGCQHGIANFEL